MVGMAATMRCRSIVQGWVWEGRSSTYGRVCDDTAIGRIVFHGDVEIDADEYATALYDIGKVVVVDEELV